MSAPTAEVRPAPASGPGRSLRAALRRPGIVLAWLWIAVLVLAAIAPSLIAPYDPLQIEVEQIGSGLSWAHPLGVDSLGRDVLSRALWGSRDALVGCAIAVASASVVGIPWGLWAGYSGKAVDSVLMRVADGVLAFPGLILALCITSALGSSLAVTMCAIGVAYAPVLARVQRSAVLVVRQADYVQVTRMYGKSDVYRMVRHVLPNSLGPVAVQVTLLTGFAIGAQSGLAYLGIGLTSPQPQWGADLALSFPMVLIQPSATIAPGAVVALTVMALYAIGEHARDRSEARQRS